MCAANQIDLKYESRWVQKTYAQLMPSKLEKGDYKSVQDDLK